MTHVSIFVAFLAGGVLLAQEQPESKAIGSISGVVRDSATGLPLPEVQVSATGGPTRKTAVSDAEGRYSLSGLEAGRYRISCFLFARGGPSGSATKYITVAPGQEVKPVDLGVRTHGEISGKVLDSNKEPVPGISVFLVAREYSLGILRHVFAAAGTTDDQGAYTVGRVEPGRAYLLVAQKRPNHMDALSRSPLNPKLRRPAVVPTYFPNVSTLEAAQPFVLQPGEKRDGIDIQLARAPAYCIEGAVQTPSGAGSVRFQLDDAKPGSGASGDGAFYISKPGGVTGPDAKFRICDLPPGDHLITALPDRTDDPSFWGSLNVTIFNRDVTVQVPTLPKTPVSGEVVWDGRPPEPPLTVTVTILPEAITRTNTSKERAGAKVAIPGTFTFENGLIMDEFRLRLLGVPPSLYVKAITYGGRDILREPFRPGTALGDATLRIVLAQDGGTVNATVRDREGNAIPDANVVLLPAVAANEAAVAAAMIFGQADQNGAWRSGKLAPGKYLAVAVRTAVNMSPEVVNRLWNARSRAQEVELGPGAEARITVPLAGID